VLGQTTGNTDTQNLARPGLGGNHHLTAYSILCTSPRGPHPNGFLSRESPEIAKVGTPAILWCHNFACRPLIEMRSEAKLYPSSRIF